MVSSLDWSLSDVPVEGWVAQSARRFPSNYEPPCLRCGLKFRESLFRIFHPSDPGVQTEVCEPCAKQICDDDFGLPEVEEAWVRVDLAALGETMIVSNPDTGLGAQEEDEYSTAAPAPGPVSSGSSVGLVPGVGVTSGPSRFEDADLSALEGQGWRISSKGNLFCHQRNYLLVIYPDKVTGFRLQIDGVTGKLIYSTPAHASLCGQAAVQELLCRGVSARKLRESSGGREVSVQREMSLR